MELLALPVCSGARLGLSHCPTHSRKAHLVCKLPGPASSMSVSESDDRRWFESQAQLAVRCSSLGKRAWKTSIRLVTDIPNMPKQRPKAISTLLELLKYSLRGAFSGIVSRKGISSNITCRARFGTGASRRTPTPALCNNVQLNYIGVSTIPILRSGTASNNYPTS